MLRMNKQIKGKTPLLSSFVKSSTYFYQTELMLMAVIIHGGPWVKVGISRYRVPYYRKLKYLFLTIFITAIVHIVSFSLVHFNSDVCFVSGVLVILGLVGQRR